MKKIVILTSVAFVLASFVSCNKDVTAPVVPELQSFDAVQAEFDTRTTIDGVSVKWKSGDAISVFDGGTTSAGANFTTSIATPATTASFSGSGAAAVDGKFYAFYPNDPSWFTSWNKDGDGKLRFKIPSTQYAVKNSFSKNGSPMLAKGTGSTLTFEHLAGYIKFTIGDDSPTDLVSVAISEGGGAKCAGTFTYEYATATKPSFYDGGTSILFKNEDDSPFEKGVYYVAVRPRKWAGITMTFTNTAGKQAAVTYNSEVDLGVGKLQDVGRVRNLSYGSIAIGDMYEEAGVNKGIVVRLEADCYYVMSLSGASLVWSSSSPVTAITTRNDGAVNTATISGWTGFSGTTYPAAYYCTSMGTGWYMPASNEMKECMTQCSFTNADAYLVFNKKITDAGGVTLGATYKDARFWCSDTNSNGEKGYYTYVNSSGVITAGTGVVTNERHTRCLKKISL